MECNCPNTNPLTTIPTFDCPINMKQIQRLSFQRGGNSFNTGAGTPTDIRLLADWQAALIAADDSKIVITPTIGADPVITAGDPITTGGGDNSTLNGVEEKEGTNPASFSCMFKSLPPEIELAMKGLECELDLTVYFHLEGGRIAAKRITQDVEYSGFDLQSMHFSDRNNSGFATKDTHLLSFQLPAGWSEDMEILDSADLNFNSITAF